MKRTLTILSLSLLLFSAIVLAQRPTKILGAGRGDANFRMPYHQTSDVHLSKDTTYVLTGWYFIDSLYKITIEPGTLIFGDKPSGGTLIIKRGAKIIAEGTAYAPIVFTSEQPIGSRAPGDWGGVIVLGNAPTNQPLTATIEGGFGTVPNSDAHMGGSIPDDSSGVLRYIRIEWAGIAFAQDNEINGLTLGGVGSKTVVDYVQVSFAQDDDIEFFGGAVSAKHIITNGNIDDNMDTDWGWSGNLQFVLVKRDSTIFDASGNGQSNGFESDNYGTEPWSNYPRTKAKISNATFIGPMSDTSSTVNAKWGHLALLRRATQFSIYNSVLMGWPIGVNIRDTLTQRAAMQDSLQIRSTSIQTKSNPTVRKSISGTEVNIPEFDALAWFNTSGWGNLGGTPRNNGEVGLVNSGVPFTNPSFDPRPTMTSEVATAGTGYRKWGLPTWFDSVSYRGALDPGKPMSQQWFSGWAVFDPQNFNYGNWPPAHTITVDGEKDAFYSTLTGPSDGYLQLKSSAYNDNGKPVNDADLSAKIWGAWDDTWFYLYTEVMDDTISGVGTNSYQDDGLELKFDPQPKDSIVNSIFGANLTILGGAGSDSLNIIPPAQKAYARKIITGGYALELAINWAAIGTTEKVSVAVDSAFGLAINIHDDDYLVNPASGNARQASIMWAAVMLDAAWNTPKYLGTVKFKSGNKLEFIARNNMTGVTNTYKYDGTDIPLSVRLDDQGIPTEYAISQNYPNPFNPSTKIAYSLPVSGFASLKVYDVVGREVAVLVNGYQQSGRYNIQFNAQNLSSGMYFYQLKSGNFVQTMKMLLVK